jgi:chromosome segregation ATPase
MATDDEYEQLRAADEESLALRDYIRLRVREKVDAERARTRGAEERARVAADAAAQHLAELTAERHARAQEGTEAAHQIETLSTRADRAEAAALDLEAQVNRARVERDALRTKGENHDVLAATKDNLAESVSGLERQVAELTRKLETAVSDRESAQRELQAQRVRADALGSARTEAENRYETTAARARDLEEAIARKRSRNTELKREVDRLSKEILDAARRATSDTAGFVTIMNIQKKKEKRKKKKIRTQSDDRLLLTHHHHPHTHTHTFTAPRSSGCGASFRGSRR